MIIGVDVDGVVANFVGKVLEINEKLYNVKIKYEDVTCDLSKIIGDDFYDILKYMEDNETVRILDVYPGAINGIHNLRSNHDVVFVTAPCWHYKNWTNERRYWLMKNFYCTDNDIIFANNKNLFDGDILIDDNSEFLKNWNKKNKPCIRFKQPWNNYCKFGIPADNFDDIISIIGRYL